MTMKYSFSIARKDIRLEKHDWRTTSHDGKNQWLLKLLCCIQNTSTSKAMKPQYMECIESCIFKKDSKKQKVTFNDFNIKKTKHF